MLASRDGVDDVPPRPGHEANRRVNAVGFSCDRTMRRFLTYIRRLAKGCARQLDLCNIYR